MLAMYTLRHKTRHTSFTVGMPLICFFEADADSRGPSSTPRRPERPRHITDSRLVIPWSALKRLGAESLIDKIRGELVGKILSGELHPGDRLPPERDMAEQMGVSRSSLHQAVLQLEDAGLTENRVPARHGRG